MLNGFLCNTLANRSLQNPASGTTAVSILVRLANALQVKPALAMAVAPFSFKGLGVNAPPNLSSTGSFVTNPSAGSHGLVSVWEEQPFYYILTSQSSANTHDIF